jgi:coproporphyrinogen III oxidase
MVPTVHANWRYFEMYDENGNIIQQWFGGGQDLTLIIYLKKITHFHQTQNSL